MHVYMYMDVLKFVYIIHVEIEHNIYVVHVLVDDYKNFNVRVSFDIHFSLLFDGICHHCCNYCCLLVHFML